MSGRTADVLIRTVGRIGRITLNRPNVLNALTREMIASIGGVLAEWAHDKKVIAVLMDGAGERGLCAGGDIRWLYEVARAKRFDEAASFFANEYRMNAKIAAFPKPHIALMDGVIMGGGIGISSHGSRRIVTDRAVLSMPEVSIGMIPDAGGTFLLSRAPDELGIHAALTAMRLSAADAIVLRLADKVISADSVPSLIEEIERAEDTRAIDQALEISAVAPGGSWLEGARSWIVRCYRGNDMEAITAALDASPNPGAHAALRAIHEQSPTALKITLRALREAQSEPVLRSCLCREFRLAMRCLQSHDFLEGVRAKIIDKDDNPVWQPASLEKVSAAMADRYFSPFDDPRFELVFFD